VKASSQESLSERFLADHGNISGLQHIGNDRAVSVIVEMKIEACLCLCGRSAIGIAAYEHQDP
jgi:hypothetical protein